MELTRAIETRNSIREFTDEPIQLEDLRDIIRLAGMAPSINNYQPWKYYAISRKSLLEEIADAVTREIALMPESSTRLAKQLKNQVAWFSTFFQKAPLLLALAGRSYESDLEYGVQISPEELKRIKNYPDLQSAGASVQNLLLAATDRGYGTCWMTGPLYARQRIEELLSISTPWQLISFIAIGKAKRKEQKGRKKRDLSDEMILID